MSRCSIVAVYMAIISYAQFRISKMQGDPKTRRVMSSGEDGQSMDMFVNGQHK